MADQQDSTDVVALVIIRPASKRRGEEETAPPISTENLRDVRPAPDDVEVVSAALRRRGFTVGPLVGIAMSISGSKALFETVFATTVAPSAEGGWVVRDERGQDSRELPLEALEPSVRQRIGSVVFEPPADLDQGETVDV